MAGRDAVRQERATGRRPGGADGKGGGAGLADRIAEWIVAKAQDAGVKGAVVGLSGGIDSAVTAALCKRALGGHVLGVVMPCESVRADEEDAALVAAELGIPTVTVRLDEPFQALVRELEPAPGLARSNLKPRLRMTTLYYYANSRSYMVVGTGNRTEIMAGYFTKHGDGGVDILPLGGLYKTQVRALARELGLPQRIIDKPPSAGLWEGQTDEGELGISYEELDRALAATSADGQAVESGSEDGLAPEVLARVREMVARSAHKRALAPVCEVTP